MPDRKKTVSLWSPRESNLFTFFAKIFFFFIGFKAASPQAIPPDEAMLEHIEDKGLDGGKGESGGEVQERDQLGHQVGAPPKPLHNNHPRPRSKDNWKKMHLYFCRPFEFTFTE